MKKTNKLILSLVLTIMLGLSANAATLNGATVNNA
jgi:hypothetical protein